MENISLKQLLGYYELEGEPEHIQVVSGNQGWDDADEVSFNSLLLKPFLAWKVKYMNLEKSYRDNKSVIRIAIAEDECEKSIA